MVVDYVKKKVIVQYHMNEGEISPIIKEHSRENMLGFAKVNETGGDKKAEDPLYQLEFTKLLNLEKDCV